MHFTHNKSKYLLHPRVDNIIRLIKLKMLFQIVCFDESNILYYIQRFVERFSFLSSLNQLRLTSYIWGYNSTHISINRALLWSTH